MPIQERRRVEVFCNEMVVTGIKAVSISLLCQITTSTYQPASVMAVWAVSRALKIRLNGGSFKDGMILTG